MHEQPSGMEECSFQPEIPEESENMTRGSDDIIEKLFTKSLAAKKARAKLIAARDAAGATVLDAILLGQAEPELTIELMPCLLRGARPQDGEAGLRRVHQPRHDALSAPRAAGGMARARARYVWRSGRHRPLPHSAPRQ